MTSTPTTAPQADLLVNACAGFSTTFILCEAVPGQPNVPGSPVDVTGWTAAMAIRSAYGDGLALELTSEGGGIVVGTTDGTFIVNMLASQTADLPSRGVYDLLVTPPEAEPIRLVQGAVIVSPAVTTSS